MVQEASPDLMPGFLARYSGRTLDAFRHDLRGFFHPCPTCHAVAGSAGSAGSHTVVPEIDL